MRRWIVAVLFVGAGCADDAKPTPTCEQALEHFFGVGCVYYTDATRSQLISKPEMIMRCHRLLTAAPLQCRDEVDDWIECNATVPGVDGGGPGGGALGRAWLTSSFAMFLPVSSASLSTLAARFMKPTVSAMALAETRPARSLSSIASVKRVNVFELGASRSAYRDSMNST